VCRNSKLVKVNAFLPRRVEFVLSVLAEVCVKYKSFLLAYMVNYAFIARRYDVKNSHESLNMLVEKRVEETAWMARAEENLVHQLCAKEVKRMLKLVPHVEGAAKLAERGHGL